MQRSFVLLFALTACDTASIRTAVTEPARQLAADSCDSLVTRGVAAGSAVWPLFTPMWQKQPDLAADFAYCARVVEEHNGALPGWTEQTPELTMLAVCWSALEAAGAEYSELERAGMQFGLIWHLAARHGVQMSTPDDVPDCIQKYFAGMRDALGAMLRTIPV